MAEPGPQVQDIPALPHLQHPSTLQAPQQLEQPAQPPQQGQQMIQMNWSHFKPEYSGKQEEDVEAHLLRTNDWMTTHNILEGTKVQRFCLTL